MAYSGELCSLLMIPSTEDQRLVDHFIKILIRRIIDTFPQEIDFAILFGSAARGEFIRGVSDIDLIIQVKRNESVKDVELYATKQFWKLDQEFRMGFEQACATRKNQASLMEQIFSALEMGTNLYTPLFIFGPDDIDWEHGLARKESFLLGANLIASQATIFHKLKTEGKLYYGRDIRKCIRVRFTWWERWKGIVIPQYLTLFALLIMAFFPRRAVKYCNKAILWEIDSALLYLLETRKLPKEEKIHLLQEATEISSEMKHILKMIRLNVDISIRFMTGGEFNIVQEALTQKIHGFSGSAIDAFTYCLRCFWFILRLNSSIVLRTIRI